MNMRLLKPYLHSFDRTKPIELVVMHATDGPGIDGAIETLRENDLGYHFLIEGPRDTDGACVKAVPYTRGCYHAGNSYGPREQAAGITRKQDKASRFVAGTSVNGYSIGVSFVKWDRPNVQITSKQYESARELVKELARAVPTLKYVTTHAVVSPGRKTDPVGFDLDRFAIEVGLQAWRLA